MMVPTALYTTVAAGSVIPFMICATLATGTGAGASTAGGASRDVRAAAMTNPIPLMKSATLTRKSH